jgi:hypothetical protein
MDKGDIMIIEGDIKAVYGFFTSFIDLCRVAYKKQGVIVEGWKITPFEGTIHLLQDENNDGIYKIIGSKTISFNDPLDLLR